MEGFKGAYMKQEEDTIDIKTDMLRQYKTMQVPETQSLSTLQFERARVDTARAGLQLRYHKLQSLCMSKLGPRS